MAERQLRLPPERFLKVAEVMERTGLGHHKVYALIRTGELPSVKSGKYRRIREADLNAFKAERGFTDREGRVVIEGFVPTGYFVYLLWGHDPARPLYVGQSINILARLGKHAVAWYAPNICRVTVLRCRSEADMMQTEAMLIAEHKPLYNIQRNGAAEDD